MEETPKKQIFQVVCVVSNLDETLGNWRRLVDFNETSIKMVGDREQVRCLYHGHQIHCPIRAVRFDLGGIDMKLVEPLNKAGGDPYSDSLLAHGQGFHHLGIYVENQPALLEQYQQAGRTPVYEEFSQDGHYQMFDFTEELGFCMTPWDHMIGPCAPRDPLGATI